MDLQRGREFDQFLVVLDRLCQRFAKYRSEYRKRLDEYSLRNEYLGPFFEALGWDVSNTKDDPPFMRDVRVEYRAYDGVINGKADERFGSAGSIGSSARRRSFPRSWRTIVSSCRTTSTTCVSGSA